MQDTDNFCTIMPTNLNHTFSCDDLVFIELLYHSIATYDVKKPINNLAVNCSDTIVAIVEVRTYKAYFIETLCHILSCRYLL